MTAEEQLEWDEEYAAFESSRDDFVDSLKLLANYDDPEACDIDCQIAFEEYLYDWQE